ncbi:hypothetical protein L6452_24102 [Arctium lappa]|uniref:Uncharacterized protein n=1 Tax=Arctium lappa TaxID=4217 RepID=A0ACB9A979_ARCLA|nr:hypothetical protein L6452_24102 [Arctium lappa]
MERGDEFLDHLPPGFRFHPTDEELIENYLQNKVNLRSIPASVIAEIELYNFDPWDLPLKALFGEDEWFFFSPRDRKYPKGSRPRRSAGSGFWKATGKDKPIFASSGSRRIGVKKVLAFFIGNPTKNVKTSWTMSEYRLPESSSRSSRQNGSMRLDDWVLCRIRQKGNMSKNKSEVAGNLKNKPTGSHLLTTLQELPSSYMITKVDMDLVSDRRLKDFQLMASILAGQALPPMIESFSDGLFQGTKTNNNNGLVYENGVFYKENVSFMLNENNVEPTDVLTSDGSYDVLDANHLDIVMKLFKDESFKQG